MSRVPSELRREYGLDSLNESDMAGDPVAQFDRWFSLVLQSGIPEPNAMTLATVDASGAPSARIVLLKGFDPRGFTFFTNYQSRKGKDLSGSPRAALCFYWQPLERQVRIEGIVEKVSRQESEEYFHSRPRGAQIGAWVSQQSEGIETREILEQRAAELEARFGAGVIPLPAEWGGFRVVPQAVEFWQGRPSRLHDRLQYLRAGEGWTLRRLSP